MLSLPDLQRAFGGAIFDDDLSVAEHVVDDAIAATDRLRIYRNTAFSTLTDALRLTYPAVERLVGAAYFGRAAAAFIRHQPPTDPYLTLYGAAFAEFLAGFLPAGTLAYLPDVARFEWALNIAANAPDVPALAPASLMAFDPDQLAHAGFVPHPSLCLLRLDFPADRIADAVLAGDDAAMAAVDLADGPVWLIAHRGPEGVDARRLNEREWQATKGLCAGLPLDHAVAAMPDFDPTSLLADHLAKGRFAGIVNCTPSPGSSS